MKRIPFIIMISAVVFLIGCGINNPAGTQKANAISYLHSASGTHKDNVDIFVNTGAESSIVSASNSLYMVISGWNTWKGHIKIYEYFTHSQFSDTPSMGLQYISAIASGSRLYLFGSIEDNKIYMSYSDDWRTWSASQAVYIEPVGQALFNTSVKPYKNGLYLMAVEFRSGTGLYNFKLLTSPDLINWTQLGNPFSTQTAYAACPEIIYDAQYDKIYVHWLHPYSVSGSSQFAMSVSRTSNGINWQHDQGIYSDNYNYFVSISPQDGYGEGTNNSDIAISSINGMTYIVYLTGNQQGLFTLRTAIWPYGDEIQYCRSFYTAP